MASKPNRRKIPVTGKLQLKISSSGASGSLYCPSDAEDDDAVTSSLRRSSRLENKNAPPTTKPLAVKDKRLALASHQGERSESLNESVNIALAVSTYKASHYSELFQEVKEDLYSEIQNGTLDLDKELRRLDVSKKKGTWWISKRKKNDGSSD